MNDTQNLHLPQFAETDRIHHDDFNDAFAKIDTAVAANNTAITGKASTAALTAEATARQNADTALQNADAALSGRIDSEAAARAAADAAIRANLGSHGHNCRIVWGSYTGSDTCGAAHPNTLTFDFCPVMLFLGTGDYEMQSSDPTIFMRGRSAARSAYPSSGSSDGVNLIWGDNSISWYAGHKSVQMNDSQNPCFYVVLGYDKAAEDA